MGGRDKSNHRPRILDGIQSARPYFQSGHQTITHLSLCVTRGDMVPISFSLTASLLAQVGMSRVHRLVGPGNSGGAALLNRSMTYERDSGSIS
jgi:hypothetical protein